MDHLDLFSFTEIDMSGHEESHDERGTDQRTTANDASPQGDFKRNEMVYYSSGYSSNKEILTNFLHFYNESGSLSAIRMDGAYTVVLTSALRKVD
ncbi:hypothetical protein [Desertibacillus haloalkaliphilus]|uniref:hypothetical protein n=1 Tax=Desertibacillus haloalkaliphilus TaxID=1328930 RepID=UPI001C25313D|nr:hypothetical protein [Desertibacillus haloalkaliphilus]MBU8908161.1 hypothetical protein [Desertibacillus haloalkaliphilus]